MCHVPRDVNVLIIIGDNPSTTFHVFGLIPIAYKPLGHCELPANDCEDTRGTGFLLFCIFIVFLVKAGMYKLKINGNENVT